MEHDLLWKKTSKIKIRNISLTTGLILLQFETWKKTSNIQSENFTSKTYSILIKCYGNFKRPFMEVDFQGKKNRNISVTSDWIVSSLAETPG